MGYYPKKFKTAVVNVLSKPNTTHFNPIKCKPIYLLEVTGKVLEKIINKKLRRYLETNNKLSPHTTWLHVK